MDMAAHDARPEPHILSRVPLHLPLFLALVLTTLAGVAGAATLRVGIDEGASQQPLLSDPCSTGCTLEVYVDLDDGSVSPDDREASVFQMDFDIVTTGAWDLSVDFAAVNPEVDPIGVGSWPNAVGSLTTSRVSVSLTSDNLGGERLVLQLLLVPPENPDFGDAVLLYLTSDSDRIIVARDASGGLAPVSLTEPAPGIKIAVVPEPATFPMLAAGIAGLMGLTALRRRRCA